MSKKPTTLKGNMVRLAQGSDLNSTSNVVGEKDY